MSDSTFHALPQNLRFGATTATTTSKRPCASGQLLLLQLVNKKKRTRESLETWCKQLTDAILNTNHFTRVLVQNCLTSNGYDALPCLSSLQAQPTQAARGLATGSGGIGKRTAAQGIRPWTMICGAAACEHYTHLESGCLGTRQSLSRGHQTPNSCVVSTDIALRVEKKKKQRTVMH